MHQHHASPPTSDAPGVSRRQFLGLLAASAAAEAVACRRAIREPIVPYVRRPADVHADATTTFATTLVLDGYATGVLVACRDGRPIKVEGNPDHPASLGGTGPIEQAAVLQLYDPDRSRAVTLRGRAASFTAVERILAEQRANHGAGLRLLLPPTSSLTHAHLLDRVAKVCPEARVAFHAPLDSGHGAAGARLAFGRALAPVYDLERADVVLALDADVLGDGPFRLRYAHQWAKRRNPDARTMNRLYCAEAMVSVTGSVADHRLPMRSSDIAQLALRVGAELAAELPAGALPPTLAAALGRWRAQDQAWVRAVAHDLATNRGRAVVVVGERQPAPLHALAHALNRALGLGGDTVSTVAPVLVATANTIALPELAAELAGGKVRTLVILEGNPAYDAPVDLDLGAMLRRVPTSVYLGAYQNETAAAVQWCVPAAHAFESWGDARALDGTVSLIQPLLATMHGERSAGEFLAALAEPTPAPARLLVRRALAAAEIAPGGDGDFERRWREGLRSGLLTGTASPPLALPVDGDAVATAIAGLRPEPGTEINLLVDAGVHDGRFTNNGWLLELPRPISSLCWGNAAYLGPDLARTLGVANGDVVELELAGRRLEAPAFVVAGHAADAVSLHLGFGRAGAEHLARGVGSNAYGLRPGSEHFRAGLVVRRTGKTAPLAVQQLEHQSHGRALALAVDLPSYRARPEQFAPRRSPQPSLLPDKPRQGEQWAMSIDLGQCIGCGACVVACQAENNVPVVGAAEVRHGRAMHWLRIDSYVEQGDREPRTVHQPMACQHCEDAPCEYVCPVNATVHSPDGLNEMVYNRCVGTRFCSNNCPYKVRRFNWFDWHEREDANQGLVRLQRNPEVTVRDRGVMEKCTYCVQRIRHAQIDARLADRELGPGEVRTACQQACPTQAIAFGSLAHRGEPVVERRESKRAYEVLHEQGTRPRTWYLARVDNPNPSLVRS